MNSLLHVLAVILVLAASQAKAWSLASGGTANIGNDTGSGSHPQGPAVTCYGRDAIGNGIANAGKAIATDPKGVFNAAKDDIAFQTNLLVSDVKNFVGASEVRSAAMSEISVDAVKHEIANFDVETFGENFLDNAQAALGAGIAAKILKKLPTGKNSKADSDAEISPTESGCFIAGTLLALSQGQEPIEQVRNGRRSLTRGDPTIPDIEIDPSTWREVTMRGENLELKQLWSPAQLAGVFMGSTIPFSNDEFETHGELTIISIEPCPPIEEGPGRLILSTSRRLVSQVLRLEFDNGHAIHGVTPNHPIYSLDRHDYVPAGALGINERVGTRHGETHLTSAMPLGTGPVAVYNVEIDAVHCYYVGAGEFLAHNTCTENSGDAPKTPAPVKNLTEQAADLVPLNSGRNRVTLRSPSQQMEVDLAGKSQGGVPTPHTKVSPLNPRAPNQLAFNTKNSPVEPTTQQDIRTVRRYL